MNRLKTSIFKAGLNAMHLSGMHHALAPMTGGLGVIFTMHHVSPKDERAFSPNRLLTITPEFLEAVVTRIRHAGLEIVSLDEAHARLIEGKGAGRFAVLTFDDGYLDNFESAHPVLKRMNAPFCVYVATGVPDKTLDLWWLALEAIVRTSSHIDTKLGEESLSEFCETDEAKNKVYERIYWWMRDCGEDRQRTFIRQLAEQNGFDLDALCASLAMSWDQVRQLNEDPLVTIGAHTINHYALAKVDAEKARHEMLESRDVLARELGEAPVHFSYPYGDAGSAGSREFKIAADLGFKTAVTTRPGVLFPEHGEHLHALPRVSLNGEYQEQKYLDLFLSGAPFGVFNKFRKLNVA